MSAGLHDMSRLLGAIKETLQSLLDSTYPKNKLRIICIDDCSTDDSYEQAREIARKSSGRLKVIRDRLLKLGEAFP